MRVSRGAHDDAPGHRGPLLRAGLGPDPGAVAQQENPRSRAGRSFRIADERALGAYFDGGAQNIGVLLGEPSRWLVEVDLDGAEALRLARVFLPPTASRFGRTSRRQSHWVYYATTPVETAKFPDPDEPAEDRRTLVELRSTGGQTVFPGSEHPSGEPVEWDEDGEPTRLDAATLRTAVTHLAAAALLARHWPGVATHQAALAAAGLLLRGGLDRVDVERIVTEAARAAGDDEAQDRRRNVPTTDDRLRIGQPVTGGRTLAECLRGNGEKVVTALRTWLGLLTPLGAEPCTDVTTVSRSPWTPPGRCRRR